MTPLRVHVRVKGDNDGEFPDLIFLLLNFIFFFFVSPFTFHHSPFTFHFSSAVFVATNIQHMFRPQGSTHQLSPAGDGVSRTRHKKIIFSLAYGTEQY